MSKNANIWVAEVFLRDSPTKQSPTMWIVWNCAGRGFRRDGNGGTVRKWRCVEAIVGSAKTYRGILSFFCGLGKADEAGRFYEPPQRRGYPAAKNERYSGKAVRPTKYGVDVPR